MTQSKSDNWVRIFQVDDPKKHRNGFTIYKVTSVVFPKNAPEAATNIVVWKRYNDFKVLHNSLKIHHKNCNISDELPKLSKAKYFKRFDEDIIEERIRCILRLLNFIGGHPPLFTCPPFIQFFNNGYQVSDTVSECERNPVANDNGNVTDSPGDLLNLNFMEKCRLNGEMKTDVAGSKCAAIPVEPDDPSANSSSSDDESVAASEGTEYVLPDDFTREGCRPFATFGAKDPREKSRAKMTNRNRSLDEPCVVGEDASGGVRGSADDCFTAGQAVTRCSEKPVKDSEVWVYVTAEDATSKSFDEDDDGQLSNGAVRTGEDYLVEAAYHIGQAQRCEIAGDYEASFSLYKGAIACLLNGISDEESEERKLAVQEKIKKYAEKAEQAYSLHLSKKKEEKEKMLSCTEGLKAYKVLQIIEKVLLVMNTADGKQYVIKVLEKSPCPIDVKKKTVIPYNVPYMVKLMEYFENDNSIFLVLQYARCGRLYDHVDRYFQAFRESAAVFGCDSAESGDDGEAIECDGDGAGKSYFELLTDYTTETARKMFGYGSDGRETAAPTSACEGADREGSSVDADADVSHLVKNSQRLLESIKNTLESSEHATDNLTKDIISIESVISLDEESVRGCGKSGRRDALDCRERRRRRSKSVARSRFERRFSSEDVLESKSRTSSNSLDRSSQWSRLAAMLESAPTLSESRIREWAAEMFVALETLHRWGITCRDLRPDNLLLDEKGHILLTFQMHWRGVDSSVSEEAVAGLYAAPETTKIFPVTSAADWWSFGAVLFELLTGRALADCYPSGILGHTILTFPEFLSPEACSLLVELLRYEPSERLGGGVNGSDDIRCHPFFSSIDWQLIYNNI